MKAALTTNSPSSHYGIPVLRIVDDDGNVTDLGPADPMPPGMGAKTAAEWAVAHASELGLDLTRSFCSQWPDGPQPQ